MEEYNWMIRKSKLSDLDWQFARLHFPGSIMAMVKTRLDKLGNFFAAKEGTQYYGKRRTEMAMIWLQMILDLSLWLSRSSIEELICCLTLLGKKGFIGDNTIV